MEKWIEEKEQKKILAPFFSHSSSLKNPVLFKNSLLEWLKADPDDEWDVK